VVIVVMDQYRDVTYRAHSPASRKSGMEAPIHVRLGSGYRSAIR